MASKWADDFSDDESVSDRARLVRPQVQKYGSTPEQTVQEHEQGLERLGQAVKRQKYMAEELATEVELHNEILEDIDSGVTNAQANIQKSTRNINLILKNSGTCYLWTLILVLGAAIIALAIL